MTSDYVFLQTKLKNFYKCTEEGLGKKNEKIIHENFSDEQLLNRNIKDY